MPPFGVSTKEAYAWHDESVGSVRLQPNNPAVHRQAGAPGNLPELGNDLQPAVARHHPEIEEMIAELNRGGAAYAAMSGSGSAVFGLFGTRAAAARAARAAATRGRGRAVVTRFVNRVRYQALAGP